MRPIRLALAVPCIAAAALFSGACSDPVPLIPRGAWFLVFQDTGAACNVETHNGEVGTVGAEGEIEYKTDGTDEAEVDCTVEPSGGAFAVNGRVRYKGQFFSIAVNSLKADATLDAPSTGTVQAQTVKSTDVYQSNECIVYFNDNGQSIESGRVWGSFQCPSVAGGAGDTCEIQQGYFAFENCVGGETEDEE